MLELINKHREPLRAEVEQIDAELKVANERRRELGARKAIVDAKLCVLNALAADLGHESKPSTDEAQEWGGEVADLPKSSSTVPRTPWAQAIAPFVHPHPAMPFTLASVGMNFGEVCGLSRRPLPPQHQHLVAAQSLDALMKRTAAYIAEDVTASACRVR